MRSRVILGVAWVALVVSVGFLALFIFFIDPRFLDISGFIVFYLALFFALWSFGYIALRFVTRKKRGGVSGLGRHGALLGLCIVGGFVLSQARWLSVYTLIALVALAGGIEYYYSKKR